MRIVFAIAANTWRQFARDRIFYLAILAALLFVGFSYLLATLTIVESRKILLDFGFAAMSMAGVFCAIFLGVVAIAREIEHRIVYTVLTKPVSRASYLIGKFIGSSLVLAVSHFLLALALVFTVKNSGESLPGGFWACCTLIFGENLVVLAFAFFMSICFSSVMAAGTSIAFFLIGRSSLSFQMMGERAASEEILVLAKALYLVFPNLERFNIRDVVAYGQVYPSSMLPVAAVYALGYIAVCLGAAAIALNRRDIP